MPLTASASAYFHRAMAYHAILNCLEFISKFRLHRKWFCSASFARLLIINACSLNTLLSMRTCVFNTCACACAHSIAGGDFRNHRIQLLVMIAASLHVNHISRLCLRSPLSSQNVSVQYFTTTTAHLSDPISVP